MADRKTSIGDAALEEMAVQWHVERQRADQLLERVAGLLADRGVYHALLSEALQALHTVTRDRDRLRVQLRHLRDELRQQRHRVAA